MAAAAGAADAAVAFAIPSATLLLAADTDHYTALGFATGSGAAAHPLRAAQHVDAASIRAAYRALALHFHPDKRSGTGGSGSGGGGGGDSAVDAAQCFIRVSQAFHALKDATRRAAYDAERLALWTAAHPAPTAPAAAPVWYGGAMGASLFGAPSYQQPLPTQPAPQPKHKAAPKPKPKSQPATVAPASAGGKAAAAAHAGLLGAAAMGEADELRTELERWKEQWRAELDAAAAATKAAELARYARSAARAEAQIGRVLLRPAAASTAGTPPPAPSATPKSTAPLAAAGVAITSPRARNSVTGSGAAVAAALTTAQRELLVTGSRFQVKTAKRQASAADHDAAVMVLLSAAPPARGRGRGPAAAARPAFSASAKGAGAAMAAGAGSGAKARATSAAAAALLPPKAVYLSVWVSADLQRVQWRVAGARYAAPDGVIDVSAVTAVTRVTAAPNSCWFLIRSATHTLTLEAMSPALCAEWVAALNALTSL